VRGLALVLVALTAHPLHTTLTEISYRDADRSVEVSVRAFADDFHAAVGRDLTDSSAFAYLASVLTLSDRSGHVLRLAWCGLRQTGDLLWLCLRASAPEGLSGLRVQARLLFERYPDQINIVQASYGRRRASLLFSRGDLAKALPN
jgi:hypothetical protein